MESRLNIIVCDDSLVERTLLSRILREAGYNVVSVSSGRELIENINKNNFHLIFIDLIMPGLDGWEVSHQLKSKPIFYSGVIVGVSSVSSIFDIEKAKMNGVAEVLSKPFSKKTILESVAKHLKLN